MTLPNSHSPSTRLFLSSASFATSPLPSTLATASIASRYHNIWSSQLIRSPWEKASELSSISHLPLPYQKIISECTTNINSCSIGKIASPWILKFSLESR